MIRPDGLVMWSSSQASAKSVGKAAIVRLRDVARPRLQPARSATGDTE
jgi:hypothetical protein